MAEITEIKRDTVVDDILNLDRTTAPFFMEMGMYCLGCPASRGETLEQACNLPCRPAVFCRAAVL